MSDDGWLSDYVLGEAGEEQRREIELRMARDPQLRERVTALRSVSARVQEVPGAAWLAIAHTGDSATSGSNERSQWSARLTARLALGIAAAVALFLAGFGTRALSTSSSGSAAGRPLELSALTGGPADVSGVAYVSGSQTMVLVINHLPRTVPGHYYEAWLMTSLQKLVPLASFRVDAHGQARLTLQLPAAESAYRYIDVSLQSAAAGVAHSATSVLRGPTT